LAPIAFADVPMLWKWINCRSDVLLNAPYKPVSERQQQMWFEKIQERHDTMMFGIRLIKSQQLIGSCQLHSISAVHRSGELQMRLGGAGYRGKGYGSEALALLLAIAFDDVNLQRVYLHVFATNQPAICLYEKQGFVQEGILRKAAYINGEYLDVIVMGILRSEYAGR
jgi:RimJ/RimL family protein N-acetyltransferase